MVKVAEVTAHAMYFQVPLFHHHQQVDGAGIGQVDRAVQEVQDVPELHKVQKEHQDHQRIVAETDNWSHLLLRSQVWSGEADVPNFLSRTQPSSVHARGSDAVLKKLNWATGQNLTPIGLERVFQRCTQAMDSPLAVKMSKLCPMVPSRIV